MSDDRELNGELTDEPIDELTDELTDEILETEEAKADVKTELSASVKKEAPKNEGVKVRASKKGGGKSFSLNTWFKEIMAEFHKVVWPNKKELGKMTLTVIVVSVMFGAIIAGLDSAFGFGVGILVGLL